MVNKKILSLFLLMVVFGLLTEAISFAEIGVNRGGKTLPSQASPVAKQSVAKFTVAKNNIVAKNKDLKVRASKISPKTKALVKKIIAKSKAKNIKKNKKNKK